MSIDMIYVYEAAGEDIIAMRAALGKHGLMPFQVTPRGRIVGVLETDSLHLFALVCAPDTMELEQYALETLARIVAENHANAEEEAELCV